MKNLKYVFMSKISKEFESAFLSENGKKIQNGKKLASLS